MVLVGRLLDWLGARVMLTAVALLFGLAVLSMSSVSNQTELYLGFTVMRLLGQGAMTLIPTALVAIWFIRWRGRVMAITSLGSALSQAAFPPFICPADSQPGLEGFMAYPGPGGLGRHRVACRTSGETES